MLLTNVKSGQQLLLIYVVVALLVGGSVVISTPPQSKSQSSSSSSSSGTSSSSSNANDINSLLINDLNLIATKMDDIPETSLNLKLFLLAYECTDVKLTWKLHNTAGSSSSGGSSSSSLRTTSLAKNGELFHHHSKQPPSYKRVDTTKIFGYQVVVREYLEPKSSGQQSRPQKPAPVNSDEIYEKQNEKTVRVYSSKFIESNQNKFKLINLLRRNMASYLICLIIYMDVTETVGLEKQCVNFSLPVVSKEFDSFCERNAGGSSSARTKQSKLNANLDEINNNSGGKKQTNRPKTTSQASEEANTESRLPGTQTTRQLVLRNTTSHPLGMRTGNGNNNNNNNMHAGGMAASSGATTGGNGCEHVAQCKHYANLLVAFVVCGVLLGTNVFMFTIIIIQNTIKLGLLRHKLKIYRQTQTRLFSNSNSPNNPNSNLPNSSGVSHFVDSNKDLDDKSFLHSNSKFDKYGKLS